MAWQPGSPTDRRVGLTLLALWAGVLFLLFRHLWPGDMAALYFAGHFYATGQPGQIYLSPEWFFGHDVPAAFAHHAAADPANATAPVFPYVYPPLWAALFAPLTRAVSPEAFFQAAYALQIPMLAGSIWLAWRLAGRPMALTLWVAATLVALSVSLPFAMLVFLNQPQISVIFLVLLAADRLTAGRPATAGLLLGLAAGLKIAPILLLPMLFPGRHWRAILTALATAAALALLSFLIAGIALNLTFLERLRFLSDRVFVAEINLSLKTLLYWLADPGYAHLARVSKNALAGMAPGWLGPATLSLYLAATAVTLRAVRGLPPRQQVLRGLIALSLASSLTAPLGWTHYYTLPLMFLPLLPALYPARTGWALAALIAVSQLAPLHTQVIAPGLIGTAAIPFHVAVYLALFALVLIAPRPQPATARPPQAATP